MALLRWIALSIAVAAGIWLAVRSPDETPAPAAGPDPVATLPLPLPASAPAASAPAGTAGPPPTPEPAHATAAASTAPRIGSEGYGPHIERAQAGNDVAAAWEAVTWMRNCASNEQRRQSAELVRAQGVAPEVMTQMMVEADEEARRCQTVTALHRAMLPELAARAMHGGVAGAAAVYASSVDPGRLAPAERQEVTEAMRHDALAGQPTDLLNAFLSAPPWGISDAERLSYMYAYGELAGRAQAEPMLKALIQQRAIPLSGPPTREQWTAAEAAGKQIVERVRAGKP